MKIYQVSLVSILLGAAVASPTSSNAQQPYAVSSDVTVDAPMTSATKPLMLRVVGSNLKNLKGDYLGRIEGIVLNPATSQAEMAIVSTSYPTNSAMITPVPWSLLSYRSDLGQVGGEPGADQVFTLNMERPRLEQGPAIERRRLAEVLNSDFASRLYGYYGGVQSPTTAAMGATGTPVTSGTGAGSSGGTSSGTAVGTPPGAVVPGTVQTDAALSQGSRELASTLPFVAGSPGFVVVGTNGVITNRLETNFVNVSTNILRPTNFFVGASNVFVPGTEPGLPPTSINVTNFRPAAGRLGGDVTTGTGAGFGGGVIVTNGPTSRATVPVGPPAGTQVPGAQGTVGRRSPFAGPGAVGGTTPDTTTQPSIAQPPVIAPQPPIISPQTAPAIPPTVPAAPAPAAAPR